MEEWGNQLTIKWNLVWHVLPDGIAIRWKMSDFTQLFSLSTINENNVVVNEAHWQSPEHLECDRWWGSVLWVVSNFNEGMSYTSNYIPRPFYLPWNPNPIHGTKYFVKEIGKAVWFSRAVPPTYYHWKIWYLMRISIFRIIHVNATPRRFLANVKNLDYTKTNQHNQIHMSRNTSVVRCIDDGAERKEGAIWYNISVYKFHTFRERLVVKPVEVRSSWLS